MRGDQANKARRLKHYFLSHMFYKKNAALYDDFPFKMIQEEYLKWYFYFKIIIACD